MISKTGEYQKKIPCNIECGSMVVVLYEGGTSDVCAHISCQSKTGIHLLFPMSFGIHKYSISGKICNADSQFVNNWTVSDLVHVDSPIYGYCMSLDKILDAIIWGWEPEGWTTELECALLELLVCIDEDLVSVVHSMSRMMQTMGDRGGQRDMEHILTCILEDVRLALRDRMPYNVGRLHNLLSQFLEMTSGVMGQVMAMQVPSSFVTVVHTFIRAKLGSSPPLLMRGCLDSLVCMYH